ncbi:hypothetical protein F3Y22_tig00110556pilonHSYRG00214 [Hibiscus syriacus]|uniref:Protein kinase domain-containing protein n=1 Tax=Hibiscus syriacus TaxID=106335 RepID=A0A6A3A967_HIBSY|nr:hypothetical protein F3Y22_tig00110556pilonHSYRG00214 [Hibiscus syriacus]
MLACITYRSLNSNSFTGSIPRSIGNLSKLYWLDLADNQLDGKIPVSDGPTRPGLEWLFESNRFSGALPSTLGLVKSLEVVRFDNNSLNGVLPSNLNNLTSVHDLFLSNNQLTGPLPNLTGMSSLNTLYLSNNSFNSTDVPSWFLALSSLTTLVMEDTHLTGQIPASSLIFNNCRLCKVLKHNYLEGSLDIGPGLVDNPVCRETGATYPIVHYRHQIPHLFIQPLLRTASLCMQFWSNFQPHMQMCISILGETTIQRLFLLNLQSQTSFESLEQNLTQFFKFPEFNSTGISTIASAFSSQHYKPGMFFGPYVFMGAPYEYFSDGPAHSSKSSAGIAIGAAAGASVLFVLLVLAGFYAYRVDSLPSKIAHWDPKKSSGSIPQLKGARCFGLEELKKYTNSFSEFNEIGSGEVRDQIGLEQETEIALVQLEVLHIHELANPPIIHRDIKSTNILLDERLNAKVADFGLSKLMGDSEKGHVSTQVKGTMGYLDPEYYMTQQLTEKSDVYSFGVLMLEIVIARRPIERGKYIVREVRTAMDKTKSLLDQSLVLDLIQRLGKMAGMNPNAESASSSVTYEDAAKGANPYCDESLLTVEASLCLSP